MSNPPSPAAPDFRRLFEAAPAPYLVLTPDFTIVAVNEAYLHATGTERAAILGRGIFDVFPDNPLDPAATGVSNLRASLQRVLERRTSDLMAVQKYDIPLVGSESGAFEERFWLPVNTPVFDQQQRLTHIIHRVDDVTAVMRSQASASRMEMEILAQAREMEQRGQAIDLLRASEERFRTIADAIPQMVWTTLPDGFHDYYNRQWYEYTGVPEGSTDGEGWNGMFHADDQERAWKAWRHSLASGDMYEIQYRLRHRSGAYRWVLGRALAVSGADGAIERWVGTCTDIHDQKLAEDGLRDAGVRKDEFLAMLAHELRNPLAPISTAAQLLRLQKNDPARVLQASDIIVRQVRHLTELVDDLLDVSRVTRGLALLEMAPLDLKQVVGSAVEQARPLIEARQHELSLRLAAAPACVLGDKTRLVQVLANLLNNAAKYTPQGGSIALALAVHDKEVTISVRDSGNGIAPALLPHIFDLFIQGERSPDRAQGGLGLGLTLVKQITGLHDGAVSAASDGIGKGSTFTIVLPLHECGPVLAEAAPPRTADRHQPVRLMIVDDNIDGAQSLAALLEAQGHSATVAEDAESALARLDASIRLFILDIGLPGMDGYQLARRLRADPRTSGAILVALTGYGQAHDRVQSAAAGFDHHFVKPVDIAELERVLARAG